MRTPEGKVKDAAKKLLKQYGVWYYMPVSAGYGQHGIPDIICCFRGRFIALECKATDDGQPTALQAMQMARITEAGGMTLLVTPSSLLALDALLKLMEAQ